MTFKLVCIINSVLAFGFGIAFVIAAEPTMAMYATEGAPGMTPGGLLTANLLGAAFIGFGVVSFQARDAADSVARRLNPPPKQRLPYEAVSWTRRVSRVPQQVEGESGDLVGESECGDVGAGDIDEAFWQGGHCVAVAHGV